MPEDQIDPTKLSAKELLHRTLALLNLDRVEDATAMVYMVCERFAAADEPVPPMVLSLYALCLARQGKRKEAVETCRVAIRRDPKSATCRMHMAKIYLLADSRRKAIEEVERGLTFSPGHPELLRLQEEMGKRKPPVIGFLSRSNPINVKLGRARSGKKKAT